jgi:hypothetical protein
MLAVLEQVDKEMQVEQGRSGQESMLQVVEVVLAL